MTPSKHSWDLAIIGLWLMIFGGLIVAAWMGG